MKGFIKEYFTFNRRERNGIFVLLSLIVSLLVIYIFMDSYFFTHKVDFTEFDRQIAGWKSAPEDKETPSFKETEKKEFRNKNRIKPSYFPFNPNQLSKEKWKKLGLKDWQVRQIHNYEAAGGSFNSKADLKKIYCITDSIFGLLDEYIQLPEKDTAFSKQYQPSGKKEWKKEMEEVIVELNTADTNELMKIRGIGPSYSKRIIKYRTLLGGYGTLEQLKEVYGLSDSLYENILPHLILDSTQIVKININDSTAAGIKNHPYINWNLANVIVAYREKHGNYQTLDELREIHLVNDELYRKIAPYLTVE